MAACCKDAVELPLQKSQLSQRWLMLALLCTGLLGSYYCYDNPSATQVAMQQYFAGGSGNATSTDDDSGASDSFTVDFNNLYSVYSWPNVVLPFFGGYLSDRLGTRLMLLVFLLFITLGQAIFAVGASLPGMAAWYVMWAGRTVFGFGGESLSVAQSALIASWFGGKELAFALGLNLSLARLGSVINDKVSNYLASDYSVPTAFWAGFGVCLLSLLAGAATYALDERSEDRLRSNAGRRPLPRTSLLALALCLPAWARCCRGASSLASEQDALEGQVEGSLQEEEAGLLAAGKEGGFEPEEPTEVIELSAASQFPLSFWLLCVSCVCTYVCVLCFNNVAEAFFAQKWLATQDGEWLPVSQLSADTQRRVSDQATTLLLITYLVAAFLAPIFGAVIDYVGYRAVLTAVSSGLITVVHVLLAFLPRDSIRPEGPLVLLGLCYSIYASALWPSVALVTEKRHHGTAYGIATAVQNLGLAAIPLGVGKLQPAASCPTYDACVASWDRVELLLVCFGAAGFLASLCLNFVDARQRIPVLNWSSARVAAAREAEQQGGGEEKWRSG